jgi:3-phenylpropionate/cinnamic acid dioxygenase small subunit
MKDGRDAIVELLYTYAERIDLGDFEGVADLFSHGAITGDDDTVICEGREAVLAMYTGATRRYPDGTPRTEHVTTNAIVDVDEDAGTATCRSYFTVLQEVKGAVALQPVISGRYHDRFERADGEWRFTTRKMIPELIGELGHHLLYPYAR